MMATHTQEQKLRAAVKENPSRESITRMLEYDLVETVDKLKKTKDPSDFRWLQGQVYSIEKYIEVLSKVVS